jgi:hypothetical protein
MRSPLEIECHSGASAWCGVTKMHGYTEPNTVVIAVTLLRVANFLFVVAVNVMEVKSCEEYLW